MRRPLHFLDFLLHGPLSHLVPRGSAWSLFKYRITPLIQSNSQVQNYTSGFLGHNNEKKLSCILRELSEVTPQIGWDFSFFKFILDGEASEWLKKVSISVSSFVLQINCLFSETTQK